MTVALRAPRCLPISASIRYNNREKRGRILLRKRSQPRPDVSQTLNLLDYFVWGCRQQMVGSKRRINFKESAPGPLGFASRIRGGDGNGTRETLEIASTPVIIRSSFSFCNRESREHARHYSSCIGNVHYHNFLLNCEDATFEFDSVPLPNTIPFSRSVSLRYRPKTFSHWLEPACVRTPRGIVDNRYKLWTYAQTNGPILLYRIYY